MATLCASQLATWRRKEGGDAYGGAETEKGIPPWLLGLGIPGNTPSVSDAPGNYGGGGGGSVGGGQATARIPGMFFYHPDHLGSITMITDGHGQVLAGGERGGKSHISYRPYGEIFRTDSFGPDISKYKYTGQEEDKESGLYYYKARYYDPVIGRFAQADSMAFPDRIQGMNRMMYVEGNPMRYGDKSGNRISSSWAYGITAYLVAKNNGDSDENALMWAFSAYAIGRKKDTRSNNFFSNNDIGKGWNRTFGGRRSEERKDQTRFFQGIVLVNEIFKNADGKSQEEVAFGLSVVTMLLGMEKRKSSKKRQGSILPSDRTRNRDSNRTHSLLFNIAQYYAAIFTGYQPPKPKNNCNITDPDCTVPLDELPPGEGSTVGGAFYDCKFDPEINRFKCWGMR